MARITMRVTFHREDGKQIGKTNEITFREEALHNIVTTGVRRERAELARNLERKLPLFLDNAIKSFNKESKSPTAGRVFDL